MAGLSTGAAAWMAALPIGAILALMLGAHWSAARAGVAGLTLALALSFAFDDFDLPAPLAYAGVLAEGAFTTATILWILWPALALHHHQQRSGAHEAIRQGLDALTAQPFLQALLVGWFLVLFLEGAAGFGTPIALAAPLLVGLGVPAVQAVVLAVVGHAAGVSFGALGTPVVMQEALTGTPAGELAWRTALLHALASGALMMFWVRAWRVDPRPGAPEALPLPAWAALAAASFLAASLAIAWFLGPELATLGGSLAAALVFAGALLLRKERHPATNGAALRHALWPYAVLIVLVLLTRASATVTKALGSIAIEWSWGSFSGRWQPLLHPGTLLFVALVAGAMLQREAPARLVTALRQSASRLAPVTIALLAMLCLSRLMLHSGMVGALERAAVAGLGASWPWIAPSVGALGSFVTGSATASNVLFSSLQAQTAQSLGLHVPTQLAAQGFGAAVGNIVCPHNVVAGAATVGLAGREAEVLRQTVLPCALVLLLGGALLAWFASRGGLFP